MKAVKLNNSNVYSGVKFLNLVKKGKEIKKLEFFINEQKKEIKQERIWLEKLVQKPIA